jgi:hypothetical protein
MRFLVVSNTAGTPVSLKLQPVRIISATAPADLKMSDMPPPLKPPRRYWFCVPGTRPTWGRESVTSETTLKCVDEGGGPVVSNEVFCKVC